jgi:hypothetical protein
LLTLHPDSKVISEEQVLPQANNRCMLIISFNSVQVLSNALRDVDDVLS